MDANLGFSVPFPQASDAPSVPVRLPDKPPPGKVVVADITQNQAPSVAGSITLKFPPVPFGKQWFVQYLIIDNTVDHPTAEARVYIANTVTDFLFGSRAKGGPYVLQAGEQLSVSYIAGTGLVSTDKVDGVLWGWEYEDGDGSPFDRIGASLAMRAPAPLPAPAASTPTHHWGLYTTSPDTLSIPTNTFVPVIGWHFVSGDAILDLTVPASPTIKTAGLITFAMIDGGGALVDAGSMLQLQAYFTDAGFTTYRAVGVGQIANWASDPNQPFYNAAAGAGPVEIGDVLTSALFRPNDGGAGTDTRDLSLIVGEVIP